MFIVSTNAFADNEHFTGSLTGVHFAMDSTLTVRDDKFNTPQWSTIQSNLNVTDVVTLQMNDNNGLFTTTPTTCTVDLEITYTNALNHVDSVTKTLVVHFDTAKGKAFNFRSSFTFTGMYIVKSRIISIFVNNPVADSLFELTEDIYINRIYKFNCDTIPPTLASVDDPVNQRRIINWNIVPGADEYDLEWTFYDDSSTFVKQMLAHPSTTYPNFDFIYRNNATRATVSATNYAITEVYNPGYIFYRVRPVHYDSAGRRIEGAWSSEISTSISNYTSNHAFHWAGHENFLNWQYTAAYAEEGKRKEVASYFDGTLRNRQSVTVNNTENRAIIGETMYDHQGRAAITTIPAPIDSDFGKIAYYDKFNVDQFDSEYSRNDFDTGSCGFIPFPMDSLAAGNPRGSSGYFSTSNPEKNIGFNPYLPEAQGYPFTQTEYTPDNTGRIQRQSIAGGSHYLGSGHETKYLYGKPAQPELDRLFGNEVGTDTNYLKNMVVDANGQISVSYVDANGKTIATALAGQYPLNVQPILSYKPDSTLSVNLLDASGIHPTNTSTASTYALLTTNSGRYYFSYKLIPDHYKDSSCSNKHICDDCLYDVTLMITDNCNNSSLPGGKPFILHDSNFTRTSAYDTLCSTMKNVVDTFSIFLDAAENYNITRVVTVDQGAINFYSQDYFKQNTCLKTYNNFYSTALANTDFGGCDITCSTCLQQLGPDTTFLRKYIQELKATGKTPTKQDTLNSDTLYAQAVSQCNQLCQVNSDCQNLYNEMLADMSLGGQYCDYTQLGPNHDTCTDPASIFFAPAYQYRSPDPSNPYKNDVGQLDSVDINFLNFAPQDLTVTQFIQNWKSSWAASLVYLHPEFCYYTFCQNLDSASHHYTSEMNNTSSYSVALNDGFLNPLGDGSEPYTINMKDPFFQSGGPGASLYSMVVNKMEHYQTIMSTNLSMWQIASLMAACQADSFKYGHISGCFPPPSFGYGCVGDQNMQWMLFRGLYLSLKEHLEDSVAQAYVNSNTPPCSHYHDCPGVHSSCAGSTAYENKQARHVTFANASANLDFEPNPLNATTARHYADSELVGQCDSQCKAYAFGWAQNLKTCFASYGVSHTDSIALIQGLIAVCAGGCNVNHMFGSSNTPNYTPDIYGDRSFEDVLKRIFGPASASNLLCDSLDLNAPSPYIDSNGVMGSAVTYHTPDHCMCAKLKSLKSDYTSADSVTYGSKYANFADFLNKHFGGNISETEVYTLIGSCNDTSCFFLANPVQLPMWLTCCDTIPLTFKDKLKVLKGTEKNCCITCSDIANATTAFNATNPGAKTKPQYSEWITNYFNDVFGFNLTYQEYVAFRDSCKTNGSSPAAQADAQGTLVPVTDTMASSLASVPGSAPMGTVVAIADSISPGNITLHVITSGVTLTSSMRCMLVAEFDSTTALWANTYKLDTASWRWITQAGPVTLTDTNLAFTPVILDTAAGANTAAIWIPSAGDNAMMDVSLAPTTRKPPTLPLYLCNHGEDQPPQPPDTNSCFAQLLLDATYNAHNAYNQYVDSVKNNFLTSYVQHCMHIDDSFNLTMPFSEYHYTLYYYDQAENLVKTIPPQGVHPITTSASLAQIITYRNTGAGAPVYPSDSLITRYWYNTLNSPRQQETPDGDTVHFWYDRLGRLALSQNAVQAGFTAGGTCGTAAVVKYNFKTKTYKAINFYNIQTACCTSITGGNVGPFKDSTINAIVADIANAINSNTGSDGYTAIASGTILTIISPSPGCNYNGAAQIHTTDTNGRTGLVKINFSGGTCMPCQMGAYSYTIYDPIGRIIEVGELHPKGTYRRTQLDTLVRNDSLLRGFIDSAVREQITHTFYDSIVYHSIPLAQQNLRKRVSSITYADSNYHNINKYENALHFSYDPEGNVASMIIDNQHEITVQQRYKKVDYNYDLVSGKVNEVYYERDSADQFLQKYDYDLDNRITDVQTSHDSIYWEEDANYQYYTHGPLAREVIGQRQVQGVDYAYTINGWLKGVNSSILNPTYDMGHDGDIADPNKLVARDAYGFTLNYFTGDYTPIGQSLFEAKGLPITSLYNGNIAGATYSIKPLQPSTLGYSYSYDQLNRLVKSQVYKGIDTVLDKWGTGTTAIPDLQERMSYDENGNILTFVRHGNTAIGPLAMDSMNYYYNKGTNQLNYVADAVGASNYSDDIDNENKGNYQYNKLGQLAKDSAGGIDTITWTVYMKIKMVKKHNGDSILFVYDPFGNRIEKRYYHGKAADTTIYTRDAEGNILGLYCRRQDTVKLNEWDIYGSKRIGTVDTSLRVYPKVPLNIGGSIDSITVAYIENQKQYELTNHLGNVLATISDRKYSVDTTTTPNVTTYYLPNILSAQSYYAYGSLEEGRRFAILGDSMYKYGFNGKLKDNDIYGNADAYDYGMRMYDPRLGRFFSTDPLCKLFPHLSPYIFAGDNPIRSVDMDGLEQVDATQASSNKPIIVAVNYKNIEFKVQFDLNEDGETDYATITAETYALKNGKRVKEDFKGTFSISNIDFFIKSSTTLDPSAESAIKSQVLTSQDNDVLKDNDGKIITDLEVLIEALKNSPDLELTVIGNDKIPWENYGCCLAMGKDERNQVQFVPKGDIVAFDYERAKQILTFFKDVPYGEAISAQSEENIYENSATRSIHDMALRGQHAVGGGFIIHIRFPHKRKSDVKKDSVKTAPTRQHRSKF
jgi:RHS repeat-associated protein